MVNAQEWLDENYPKEGWIDENGKKIERVEACEIHFSETNLEGNLDLSDFTNLKFLKLKNSDNKLEWIPCNKLEIEDKLLGEGFSGKVYKAKWIGGRYGDNDEIVALKILNSQSISLKFWTEVTNTRLVDSINIVSCRGLSQVKNNKGLVMVMDYMNEGNLRQHLHRSYERLSFEDKLSELENIIRGLVIIHEQKLIHGDLHSGNILNNWRSSFITDLGLCKPTEEADKEGEIYGVLPYVAPEVLQGEKYTQESDIYSFGIVAYEIFANASPYLNKNYDNDLAWEICLGLRPNLNKLKIPQLLKEDLFIKCWNADPKRRPNSLQLLKKVRSWQDDIFHKSTSCSSKNFYLQYQKIEIEYNRFSKTTTYKIHQAATLTSKPINTKQISELLKTKKQYYDSKDSELIIDDFNLDELLVIQDNQTQSSQEARPKSPTNF